MDSRTVRRIVATAVGAEVLLLISIISLRSAVPDAISLTGCVILGLAPPALAFVAFPLLAAAPYRLDWLVVGALSATVFAVIAFGVAREADPDGRCTRVIVLGLVIFGAYMGWYRHRLSRRISRRVKTEAAVF